MKDLRAIRGAHIIPEMVAEGEHEHQDFKFAISDARKIARSISAFANNDGGRLIIGVKDNGVIAGVRNEEDIFVVEQAAERYCRPAQAPTFRAYRIEGVHVIVAEIGKAAERPVSVVEESGLLKAYYRVADENIAAHPLMVRAWELRSSPVSMAFALDGNHTLLLDLVARHGKIADTREAAIALHISQAQADAIVADLASMDLLEFVYVNGSFAIACRTRQ